MSELQSCQIEYLLEILGSVISGFVIPLKEDHKKYLQQVLIPMHKVRNFEKIQQPLLYCIARYIEKEPSCAIVGIRGLLKYWPRSNIAKEILMLQELEYFLELSEEEDLERNLDRVTIRIAKCMGSDHFQVAQRTLLLWENDSLANVLVKFRGRIFPKIFVSLQRATDHWNERVSELALCVLNMFLELEPELFTQVCH